MSGLAELRVKESDRLSAIATGLKECGINVSVGADWLEVTGQKTCPGGASIACHHDHRIAMSFLTLGLCSDQPITVDGGDMIATSYPDFVSHMRAIGANIHEVET